MTSSGGDQDCFCSTDEIHRYWRKIGGALLDRVELRVAAAAPGLEALTGEGEESSESVACRVAKAADIQKERFKGTGIRRNSRMTPLHIEQHCPLTIRAKEAIHLAAEKLSLTGRSYHGVLRTARTIADLDGKDTIDAAHVLEAAEHRRLGDDPWDIFS
jgi:magnesium chelatase family protein